jgi:hypothetical protein
MSCAGGWCVIYLPALPKLIALLQHLRACRPAGWAADSETRGREFDSAIDASELPESVDTGESCRDPKHLSVIMSWRGMRRKGKGAASGIAERGKSRRGPICPDKGCHSATLKPSGVVADGASPRRTSAGRERRGGSFRRPFSPPETRSACIPQGNPSRSSGKRRRNLSGVSDAPYIALRSPGEVQPLNSQSSQVIIGNRHSTCGPTKLRVKSDY